MSSERTIEVMGHFGKLKRVTREQYIGHWVAAAVEFMHLGLDLRDQVTELAGKKFDETP